MTELQWKITLKQWKILQQTERYVVIWHINRPSMLHVIYQVVVMLQLTIVERTLCFHSTAILQVDMPYSKPVRPYLTPRGAEASAIWHINRPSVLHMIYQVLMTLRLTIYGENSPDSAAVRRRPFRRLICDITNLRTILMILWWRRNHVTYIYIYQWIFIIYQSIYVNIEWYVIVITWTQGCWLIYCARLRSARGLLMS